MYHTFNIPKLSVRLLNISDEYIKNVNWGGGFICMKIFGGCSWISTCTFYDSFLRFYTKQKNLRDGST